MTPINVIPDNALAGESRSYLMPTYSFLKSSGMLDGAAEKMPAGVSSVAPDSLAATIGIEKDDIILDIDGETVTNLSLSDVLSRKF